MEGWEACREGPGCNSRERQMESLGLWGRQCFKRWHWLGIPPTSSWLQTKQNKNNKPYSPDSSKDGHSCQEQPLCHSEGRSKSLKRVRMYRESHRASGEKTGLRSGSHSPRPQLSRGCAAGCQNGCSVATARGPRPQSIIRYSGVTVSWAGRPAAMLSCGANNRLADKTGIFKICLWLYVHNVYAHLCHGTGVGVSDQPRHQFSLSNSMWAPGIYSSTTWTTSLVLAWSFTDNSGNATEKGLRTCTPSQVPHSSVPQQWDLHTCAQETLEPLMMSEAGKGLKTNTDWKRNPHWLKGFKDDFYPIFGQNKAMQTPGQSLGNKAWKAKEKKKWRHQRLRIAGEADFTGLLQELTQINKATAIFGK